MRRALVLALVAAISGGCDSTGPVPPAAVRIAPAAVTFDAAGATDTLVATVLDGRGRTMKVPVTWSADGSAVTLTPLGPDSVLVRSAANGSAQIRASVEGGVSGQALATVAQTPIRLLQVDGSNQRTIAGTSLPAPLRVALRDRLGSGVPGVPIRFEVTQGVGTVTDSAVMTDSAGIASTHWTLGSSASSEYQVRATTEGLAGQVTFAATAIAGPPARISAYEGNDQTTLAGSVLEVEPSVLIEDEYGNPVPSVDVSFEVTAGGGEVLRTTTRTGPAGRTAVGWKIGPEPGPNTMRAFIAGSELSVEFRATGQPLFHATINGPFAQTAMAGNAVPITPSITVRDDEGEPVEGIAVTFRVTHGGGSIDRLEVTTDADGVASVGSWTMGSHATRNQMAARVMAPTLSGSDLRFEAYGCSGGMEPGYSVTLCFTSDITPSQRTIFENAALRWGEVIVAELPDLRVNLPQPCIDPVDLRMVIDDLLIYVEVRDIDGRGGILGQAGPCRIRTAGGMPVIGLMEFDRADVEQLQSLNMLEPVILHEMAHVLGVGTLWELQSLLVAPSVSGDPLDTYFSGAGAIAAFDAAGGMTYTAGRKVPVENTGETGTINAHWRESVLRNELMTGYLTLGPNPLSLITIRSLEDLGYEVDYGAAEPYFYSPMLRAPGAESQRLPLHDDVLDIPLWGIDDMGEEVRIR